MCVSSVGLEDNGPGSIAEENAGPTVGPVHQTGHGLCPDHQGALRMAAGDKAVGNAQRIDKARTDGLDIKCDADGSSQLALNNRRRRRKGQVRRRRRHNDQIDIRCSLAGLFKGRPRGFNR